MENVLNLDSMLPGTYAAPSLSGGDAEACLVGKAPIALRGRCRYGGTTYGGDCNNGGTTGGGACETFGCVT